MSSNGALCAISQFALRTTTAATTSTTFGLGVLIQPVRAARKIATMSSNGALCVISQFALRTNSVAAISNILDLGDQIIEETSEDDCCV
jgi:hypothetical protein